LPSDNFYRCAQPAQASPNHSKKRRLAPEAGLPCYGPCPKGNLRGYPEILKGNPGSVSEQRSLSRNEFELSSSLSQVPTMVVVNRFAPIASLVSNKSTQRLHYVSSVQKLGEFGIWMHPRKSSSLSCCWTLYDSRSHSLDTACSAWTTHTHIFTTTRSTCQRHRDHRSSESNEPPAASNALKKLSWSCPTCSEEKMILPDLAFSPTPPSSS
jgi:hypothetical protein